MHHYTLPRDVADEALQRLRADEGIRRFAYDDATGHEVKAPIGNLTIGCGCNLAAGLDDEEIDWLERHRLNREWRAFSKDAITLAHGFTTDTLPRKAQLALALAVFQLGANALSEFHGMITAIRKEWWDVAANEALRSRWDTQTPHRAEEVADLLRSVEHDGDGHKG